MKDPYTILGVSRDASDEEIKRAYKNLVKKYHPDNYTDDNPLKDLANEKMQEINAAYDQILEMRARGNNYSSGGSYSSGSGNYQSYSNSSSGVFVEVRNLMNRQKFHEAERLIAQVPISDRNAEWHYLNSMLLMRRGNVNDAMRELEIACSMDPGNMEYQRAKEMFNTNTRGYQSTYYGGGYRQKSSSDEACDCCMNLICLDCLCECMGGDLIRCI